MCKSPLGFHGLYSEILDVLEYFIYFLKDSVDCLEKFVDFAKKLGLLLLREEGAPQVLLSDFFPPGYVNLVRLYFCVLGM